MLYVGSNVILNPVRWTVLVDYPKDWSENRQSANFDFPAPATPPIATEVYPPCSPNSVRLRGKEGERARGGSERYPPRT